VSDANAIYPMAGVDESSIPKRGKGSAGVKKQYCGTTGRVANCQVAALYRHVTLVLLAYAFLVRICVREAEGSLEDEESQPDKKDRPVNEPSSSGSKAESSPPHPKRSRPKSTLLSADGEPEQVFAPPPLIPLTTSEVRHLLARLIWPAPTAVPLVS